MNVIRWLCYLSFYIYALKEKYSSNHIDAILLFDKPIKRFDSAWNTLCAAVGFEDLHYHDLRHTYCSNLLLSGANIKDVKDMIGHKDLSTTDRYSHLTACHCLCTAIAEYYKDKTHEERESPKYWFATASLKVDFLKPTPMDKPVQLRARIKEMHEKKLLSAFAEYHGHARG